MSSSRIKIGDKFINRRGKKNAKNNTVETVVDIYTTKDESGKVIRVRYVTEYEVNGKKINRYNVLAPEIQMSDRVRD